MSERVAFRVETAVGEIAASIALPSRDMSLAELARAFFELDDRSTALAVTTAGGVSCRVGCAACCRQLVPLSLPEAFHLAELVERHPDRVGVEARFAELRARLDRSWVSRALAMKIDEEHKRVELAVAYHRLALACPFLEDERCSIYEARPSTCREYVVTTPREACAMPGRAPLRRVPTPFSLSEALGAAAAEALGREVEVVPLVRALDWVEAHREEAGRRFAARPLVESVLRALVR